MDTDLQLEKFIKHIKDITLLDKNSNPRFKEKDYQHTLADFDISLIPNFYKEAIDSNYFDNLTLYSTVLNKVFWIFLETNKTTKKYLDLLLKISDMQDSNEIQGIIQNNTLFKSYDEFKEYLLSNHSFDPDDYIEYCKDSKAYWDPSTKVIDSNIQKVVENILNNANDKDKSKELVYKLSKLHAKTSYQQQYQLPTIKLLENHKITFEYSVLDDEKDTIEEFKKVHSAEKKNKRKIISSSVSEILSKKGLNSEDKYFSKTILLQSALIYKYLQYCETVNDAYSIYNFHILLTQYKKSQYINEFMQLNMYAMLKGEDNPTKDLSYTFKQNTYFIAHSRLNKEIRQQIKQISNLLSI